MTWPLLLPLLKGTALTGLTAAGLGLVDAVHRIPRSRKKSYLNDSSLFRDGSYEGDVGIIDGLLGIDAAGLKTDKINAITHDTKSHPEVLTRVGAGFRQPIPGETAEAYLGSTANRWRIHLNQTDPTVKLAKDNFELQKGVVANNATAQKDANAIEKIRLADDKINRQEDRFHNLQMLQAQQQQSNNQWAREIAYYDRKDEARREEKELETLIAGLAALGANLFV